MDGCLQPSFTLKVAFSCVYSLVAMFLPAAVQKRISLTRPSLELSVDFVVTYIAPLRLSVSRMPYTWLRISLSELTWASLM